jgi:uncharacterized protein YndB with AHSA1/START domain
MSDPIIIRVTRTFTQSAERVFDAWLDPKLASKFLFATEGGEVVRCEIDARVGGRFLIVDRRAAGDAHHYGEYLEIDRPRRLAFGFSPEESKVHESRIVIEIVPRGTGCVLTLTHEMDRKYADYEERTRGGWTTIVTALATALASDAP